MREGVQGFVFSTCLFLALLTVVGSKSLFVKNELNELFPGGFCSRISSLITCSACFLTTCCLFLPVFSKVARNLLMSVVCMLFSVVVVRVFFIFTFFRGFS